MSDILRDIVFYARPACFKYTWISMVIIRVGSSEIERPARSSFNSSTNLEIE